MAGRPASGPRHRWASTTTRLVAVLTLFAPVSAQDVGDDEPAASAAAPGLHPVIVMFDQEGQSVLDSGAPVSAAITCGKCHDTDFISSHNYHATAGLDRFGETEFPGARSWDLGPGLYGRWDPITYRWLTPPGSAAFDLGTADWIKTIGRRHVGGGPATVNREGKPLEELTATGTVDPVLSARGRDGADPKPWDWKKSGTAEIDCFLCHIDRPAVREREEERAAGRFGLMATATLARTGVVRRVEDGRWEWNASAFTAGEALDPEVIGLRDPGVENCGVCHGPVHTGNDPLTLRGRHDEYHAATKGQVFSAQLRRDSGVNLRDKDALALPWDVHAGRLLRCVDCHFAPNNPAYRIADQESRPAHLSFGGRRLSIAEFLRQPDHDFARGRDGSMRICRDCHTVEGTHEWLPYLETHVRALRCEACHIPRIDSPARRVTDWTVLTREGEPRVEYRGVEGPVDDPGSLVTGFQPVILPRRDPDGSSRLAPHNLMAAWYWVAGDPPRPVREFDLRAAFLHEGGYHPEVLGALDTDRDGDLSEVELRLDSPERVAVMKQRLDAVGVKNARIEGEMRSYALQHNVVPGQWATRECTACHERDSSLSDAMTIASFLPGGTEPRPVEDGRTQLAGRLETALDGTLAFAPDPGADGAYVLGHHRSLWIDTIGILATLGVIVGAAGHGLLRWRSSREAGRS